MPTPEKKVTEEEANAALQQLIGVTPDGQEFAAAAEPEPEPEPSPEPEAAPEPAPEKAEEEAKPGEGETDDVVSLKKRLEEAEGRAKRDKDLFDSRWKAQVARQAENERILRDRYLRKANATDRALQILQKTLDVEHGGASEAEVNGAIQEIRGTLNPQSAGYLPPQPIQTPESLEDKAIVLNRFLNEKEMTQQEAEEFGTWIRNEAPRALSPADQAVAGESLDGFLRIAHPRWQEAVQQKDQEATRARTVEAVKTVQRTQREAAKAASTVPSAPRKQPAGASGRTPDIHKMPEKERNEYLASLIRASVEENR